MEICLHLGAHRTGTTSAQIMLKRQAGALWDKGLAYLGPERTRTGLMAGLLKNPNTMLPSDVKLGTRSCGRMRMEFARFAHEGCSQVLISEENVMGTMKQNIAFSKPYPQAAARLARFAPAFEGHDLRIGLCIRSYEAHWTSQLAFRIQMGAAVPDASELDRFTTQPRRWRTVIGDIRRAFPQAEIFVWTFEEWLGNQASPLNALMGREVIDAPLGFARRFNASMGRRDLHALALERGDRSGAARIDPTRGRYAPFDRNQTEKMQGDYRDDLTWLTTGADGHVTYISPTEGTFGGLDMTKGSHHDRQKRGVAHAR
ncbi:hypothetical protein C8N43_1300 [Litoreibacter ponti]|uniref:Sulfotransferase family protein n=1 Tax=Litoreibacter ponti TaxID=1510457 RepID=A0A2T6BKN9_9RHOB|nr:hypothetical protein C8N43_1300 [Litoreibacter ponti]